MRKTQDEVRLGARLRDLAAAGSKVDCSVGRTLEENLEVEICLVNGVNESRVFEMPDRRAGYIMDLEITNQTRKTIYLSEIELRKPWEDTLFDWLPDPKETGRTLSYFRRKRNGGRERVEVANESYCFPGDATPEYLPELVLNHILIKGCALQPGYPLTGLLLATGGPMPPDLRHGQWLKPTLVLIASDHREHRAQLRLWTDRLEIDEKATARMPDFSRDSGLEIGLPVVISHQDGSADRERSRRLCVDPDGDGENTSDAS